MEANVQGGEGATEARGKRASTRKKATAKAPTENGRRSLNLRVDDETYERLTIHAMRRRTTISALVMSLAKEQLREYSIHRLGTRTEQEQGA